MRLTERLRGGKRKQSQGEGLLQVPLIIIAIAIVIIIFVIIILIIIIIIIRDYYDDYDDQKGLSTQAGCMEEVVVELQ